MILIRGGGDLASGVALRLYRVGLQVVITELEHPLVVRRRAAYAEAIHAGEITVEGVTARRVLDATDTLRILQVLSKGMIPVVVDPAAQCAQTLHPMIIVDGRMKKQPPEPLRHAAALYIGLGPGFVAGENCHAVIETRRGHTLGRVLWQGSAEPDTGLPEGVLERQAERVLRAPLDGELLALASIGDHLEPGQPVAQVAGTPILAPFPGLLRGLLPSGFLVTRGLKVGDVDPRDDPAICSLVSDKAFAIGGGVLEAILTRPEVRRRLWN